VTVIAQRYEALEVRVEALKAERRPNLAASPELLAQHAAEVESLTMELATLKARILFLDFFSLTHSGATVSDLGRQGCVKH
jgi:hypothetical protein